MAADKYQRRFCMLPLGEFFFQFLMKRLFTGKQAAPAGRGTEFLNGFDCGRRDCLFFPVFLIFAVLYGRGSTVFRRLRLTPMAEESPLLAA